MRVQVIASGILIIVFTMSAQAKEWRGIVPLKSTRADVERLLGKPNGLGRYQFDDERAYIYYSEGVCARGDDCSCLVPKDTVLNIFVTLEVEMKFSDLKIDRRGYQRTKSAHLPTVVSHSNEEEGIIYTVDEDEVTEITYLPSGKDCREVVRKNRRAKHRKKLSLKPSCNLTFTQGSLNRTIAVITSRLREWENEISVRI